MMVNKRWLSLSIFVLVAGICSIYFVLAATAPAKLMDKTEKLIPYFTETHKNFGFLAKSNEVLSHQFKLVNPTNQQLAIKLIRKSCACSVIELPATIEPNSDCLINTQLSVENREGLFTSGCVVGVGSHELNLGMEYYSVPAVQIVPEKLSFLDAKHSSTVSCHVTIIVPKMNVSKLNYTISEVQKKNQRLELRLISKKEIKIEANTFPREEHLYELTVKTSNDRSMNGEILQNAISVIVTNQLSASKTIVAPVELSYRKHEDIKGPDSIVIFRNNNSKALVNIRSYDQKPCIIRNITVSNQSIAVAIKESSKNNEVHRLEVSYAKSETLSDNVPEKVKCTIIFNDTSIQPYDFEVYLCSTKE